MRRRPEERDDLLGLLEPASCRAVFQEKIRCNTLDLPIGAWNVSQVTTMESSACKPAPPLYPVRTYESLRSACPIGSAACLARCGHELQCMQLVRCPILHIFTVPSSANCPSCQTPILWRCGMADQPIFSFERQQQ